MIRIKFFDLLELLKPTKNNTTYMDIQIPQSFEHSVSVKKDTVFYWFVKIHPKTKWWIGFIYSKKYQLIEIGLLCFTLHVSWKIDTIKQIIDLHNTSRQIQQNEKAGF